MLPTHLERHLSNQTPTRRSASDLLRFRDLRAGAARAQRRRPPQAAQDFRDASRLWRGPVVAAGTHVARHPVFTSVGHALDATAKEAANAVLTAAPALAEEVLAVRDVTPPTKPCAAGSSPPWPPPAGRPGPGTVRENPPGAGRGARRRARTPTARHPSSTCSSAGAPAIPSRERCGAAVVSTPGLPPREPPSRQSCTRPSWRCGDAVCGSCPPVACGCPGALERPGGRRDYRAA
ncbi:BTAD domain-containing putative transcriptional regulator [Streptomyces sp. NPDC088560]|uniref:BTAD domain-containing putative transcriptional regulator n=1 Tax=Streptomyces sp. NPDC088560 TaxID=3365868 RepID=UPI00381B3748